MNLEDFNSIELKKIATDGDHALVTKKTSAEVVDIVTKSMSFPMEAIIKRYRKEHNIDLKTASLHERELKRFLALAAIYDVPLGMRGPVDELWHTFIIFTVDYMNFCQTVAGRMIHHVPTRDDEPIAFGKNLPPYLMKRIDLYSPASPQAKFGLKIILIVIASTSVGQLIVTPVNRN